MNKMNLFLERRKFKKKLEEEIEKFPFLTLVTQGSDDEIFLHGGFVRDFYYKMKASDLDLRVGAQNSKQTYLKIKQLLKEAGELQYVGFLRHANLYLVRGSIKNFIYDFSIIDMKLLDSLNNSVDFRLNNVLFDLKRNKLSDRFGGVNDLHEKVIQTINEPLQYLNRQPQSVLRGIHLSLFNKLSLAEDFIATIPSTNNSLATFLKKMRKNKDSFQSKETQSNLQKAYKLKGQKVFKIYHHYGIAESNISLIKEIIAIYS